MYYVMDVKQFRVQASHMQLSCNNQQCRLNVYSPLSILVSYFCITTGTPVWLQYSLADAALMQKA